MSEEIEECCKVRFKDAEKDVKVYVPLLKRFFDKIRPGLKDQLGLSNVMSVPRLLKVTLNRGIGDVSGDKHKVDVMVKELSSIACQRAVVVKARKDISNFKLRKGNPVGVMVTLRGQRMYNFLDRLLNLVLPRIRDFRGISKDGFDKTGVYNLGIKDQTVFPEIKYDEVVHILGMNITFQTSSRNKEHNIALFEAMGFPFMKK